MVYRPISKETDLSKQLLVQPKDKDPKEKKSGVIYHYQYPAIDCGDEYIGETSRTLGEQYKEHLRESSTIQVHSQLTGHQTTLHNFNILGREGQDLTRLIKEAIFVRVNNPMCNKNIGKFNLVIFGIRACLVPPILKQPFHKGMCSIALSNYISHSILGCP